MITLANLKQDMEFTRSLGDIVDVLKTAVLIQFHGLQGKEKYNKNFISDLEACFNLLGLRGYQHPFFLERANLPAKIIILTSDEGFLGELNTLLINAGVDQRKKPEDELVVLGERGGHYLEEMGEQFFSFPGIGDEIKFSQAVSLRDYLLQDYLGKFGRITLVYPEFVSLTNQKVKILNLLPYEHEQGERKEINLGLKELLIEPSVSNVLDSFIELWMGFKLYEIFWSSKHAEYAARIMHLEGSTQELSHLGQRQSFEYFRHVHTLRDNSIREITASMILLERK